MDTFARVWPLAAAAAVALAVAFLARPDPAWSQSIFEDNFDDGVIDTSIWSVEVARPGYGIWKLPELSPPFTQATEEGGELRLAGNGHDYFDYTRALVSKQTFSGSSTLEVDLTSLSGSGTQWGADVFIVKDDFTAIQVGQNVHYWQGWPAGYYRFGWGSRESCIDGAPGCPTSPGGLGTPEIAAGEAKAPGPISFPIKRWIVYDGNTQFRFYWDMGGQIYEATHNAPEVYDHYRIVLDAGARLGGDSVDARLDNLKLLAGEHPPAGSVGGILEPVDLAQLPPDAAGSGGGNAPYAAGAAAIGGLLALTAGAWYTRRRWLR